MIPQTLTLRNFMSYGDEAVVLSLEGFHVACLSGDNGNGKSALLDAMTWALWAKTRASSVKSVTEDDLIRVGAEDMEVRFEFVLEGHRYRVVRKRKRGKASDWQLAQRGPAGDFVGLGGGGQREVGRQIVQLLSMEYETFINSAYLQQGRADEFARQTPDNRKRILGEVLGLDRYDRLEAKAKERHKERKERAEELDREIGMLQAQIDRLPEHRVELEKTLAGLTQATNTLGEQEAVTARLRDRNSKLDAFAARAADVRQSCGRMEAELAQREAERRTKLASLERLQKTLGQKEAILADHNALQAAVRRREQLEPEVEAFNRVNAELQNVIGAIDVEEKQLRSDLRLAESELRAVEQRFRERTRLDADLLRLHGDLASEAAVMREWEAARVELEAAQEAFTNLRTRNENLKESIAEIDEVLELLRRPQPRCPVCDSDLSGVKQAAVVARQAERRSKQMEEQKVVQSDGRAHKQRADTVQAQVQELDTRRQALTAMRSALAERTRQRDALVESGTDVGAVEKTVRELKRRLDAGDFAGPKRAHRQRLEAEIKRLTLVKAEYETVRDTVRRLEGTFERFQELRHAEASLTQALEERQQLDDLIVVRCLELDAERAKFEAMQVKIAQNTGLKGELAAAEAELARLGQELLRLRVAESSLKSYLAQGEQAGAEQKIKRAEHARIDEERRMFQGLANAFGRKGVQALIIDNALPELEDEANQLLADMTNSGMSVRFLTTKTAKSTGTEVETLDIQITDDAGTRPYELYSGGEAFRVNLAVRIALSRLLARRSGAKLQTLILDEGFGTQDGKGREKLVEVIEAIKDDFEKILVITHVDELKDAFAQRIEVTKDALGSHVHVL